MPADASLSSALAESGEAPHPLLEQENSPVTQGILQRLFPTFNRLLTKK
jgi:hypothetical protein